MWLQIKITIVTMLMLANFAFSCDNKKMEFGIIDKNLKSETSLIRLISVPNDFDKKKITVSGFISFNDWEIYLFIREDDYRNALYKNAIRVFFNSKKLNMSAECRSIIDKSYVQIAGSFSEIAEGAYSEVSGEIHDVDYLRVKNLLSE